MQSDFLEVVNPTVSMDLINANHTGVWYIHTMQRQVSYKPFKRGSHTCNANSGLIHTKQYEVSHIPWKLVYHTYHAYWGLIQDMQTWVSYMQYENSGLIHTKQCDVSNIPWKLYVIHTMKIAPWGLLITMQTGVSDPYILSILGSNTYHENAVSYIQFKLGSQTCQTIYFLIRIMKTFVSYICTMQTMQTEPTGSDKTFLQSW